MNIFFETMIILTSDFSVSRRQALPLAGKVKVRSMYINITRR